MSDLDEATKLLTAFSKRTHSSILDEDVISAIRLLLSDYIERTRNAKQAADKLASQ